VNGVERARPGTTATSYDAYSSDWSAPKAIDGNTGTGYCSNNVGVETNWWKLDLGVRVAPVRRAWHAVWALARVLPWRQLDHRRRSGMQGGVTAAGAGRTRLLRPPLVARPLLQTSYPMGDITSLVLTNRQDCCTDRIGCYVLQLLDANSTVLRQFAPFAPSLSTYTLLDPAGCNWPPPPRPPSPPPTPPPRPPPPSPPPPPR
jgi:hypothetical protein